MGLDQCTQEEFDKRFDKHDTSILERLDISPDDANAFDSRFSGFDVVNFMNSGIYSCAANAFPERFNTLEIYIFIKNRVSSDFLAKKANLDFLDVINAATRNVDMDSISDYRKGLTWDEKFEFARRKISSDTVNAYHEDLQGKQILRLTELGFKPEDTIGYKTRKSRATVRQDGLGASQAAKDANGGYIYEMLIRNCLPDCANSYSSSFFIEEVIKLIDAGISSSTTFAFEFYANEAGYQIDPNQIIMITASGADSRTFENLVKDFDPDSVAKICDSHIRTEGIQEYVPRFDADDIILLTKNDVSGQEACSYRSDISSIDICRLQKIKCTPDIVDQYDDIFDGKSIYVLYSLGLSPDKIPKTNKTVNQVLKSIVSKYQGQFASDNMFLDDEFLDAFIPAEIRLIGTGADGVVLLDSREALTRATLTALSYKDVTIVDPEIIREEIQNEMKNRQSMVVKKYSMNIGREYYFLSKLNDPQYVVKPLKYNPEENELDLEYIKGDTIESIVNKEGALASERVKQYGMDIIKGIEELRLKGIYHRDIHVHNVMIDEDLDRAIIIDLSIATENPTEIYELNRSYGGNNDLVSLGQLMYKMATGHNLFNEGLGFSCYSAVKQGIKTTREKVYDDPELLQSYLSKVREDVKDRNLANLIVTLLDDNLWTQPSLEKVEQAKEMFERYTA
ncbi:MAG: protein kinase [Nanoarchaeota archaeon]|nr:protein kinase [Nanoarchaeota archaeon]